MEEDILPIMDEALKTRSLPQFEGIEWIDIQSDILEEQLTCIIVGLETITRQAGGQNYLRSGLGVLLFRQHGKYLGMGLAEYNFTRFTNSEMVGLVITCVENRLGLPSGFDKLEACK